jgi:polyketide synthase PksL
MQAAAASWLAQRQWASLAQWWVRGLALDWRALYGVQPPQRISLPGYPFARERYWVEPQTRAAAVLPAVRDSRAAESIDAIVSLIDSDSIEEAEALALLNEALGR